MKRAIFLQHLVLPAWAICAALTGSAQIPNGGFEDWTDHGTYTEPSGWITYNEVPTVGGATVEAGMPGHPGTFHAVITTRQSASGDFPIQGWISASAVHGSSGFPFTQRPAELSGQWRYGIQPTDVGEVAVLFTKWNGATTQPIGTGTLQVSGSIAEWQPFSVPISWLSGETPDTARIQIVSSVNFAAPVVGSTMQVDDLAFAGAAGMAAPAGLPQPFVQITRAGDQVQIMASGPGTLQFFDAAGRALASYLVDGPNTTLSVSTFPKGIFLYRFISKAGGQVAAGKWLRE